MTPRYPRLVSLLRAVDARQWIDAEALEYLGTLVTWINATGEGPSVNGRALVLTESGRDVLEMATELDNEQLLSEFYEAESELSVLCEPPHDDAVCAEFPARQARLNAAREAMTPIRAWWRKRIVDREAARRAKERTK